MRTTSISRIPTTLTKQKRALSTQLFRSTSSSQTRDDESFPNGFYPVYVHHVSKTALEHLQRKQATWLIKQGLDRGLHINPNGTFSLTFPSRQGFDAGRIWTSYDSSSKQHLLLVCRKNLAVRFLLRDHNRAMETAGCGRDSTMAEKEIRRTVDQMVYAIEQADAARSP